MIKKERCKMKIVHNETNHSFETETNGARSYLEYEIENDGDNKKMLFTHTFVAPEHRGRGIAAALVNDGLNYARQNGFEIVPVCSYVVSYLKRNPQN